MRDRDHFDVEHQCMLGQINLDDTYATLAQPLRMYALRLGMSPSDADDLVSEAFTRLIALAESGRLPTTNLRGYMMRMIRNLAVDTWRTQSRTQPSDDDSVLDRIYEPEDSVVAALNQSAARTALLDLPPKVQRALWLSDVEGKSASDVADSLGVTAVNARALLSRGRRQLRCAYLEVLFPQRHTGPTFKELHAALAATATGSAGRRQSRLALKHVEECAECTATLLEMQSEASKMRMRSCTIVLLSALSMREWNRFGEPAPIAPETTIRPPRHQRVRWIVTAAGAIIVGGIWLPLNASQIEQGTHDDIARSNITLALPQQATPAGSTEVTITMRNETDADQALTLILDPKSFSPSGDEDITISVAGQDGDTLLPATRASAVLKNPPVLKTLSPGEHTTITATISAR